MMYFLAPDPNSFTSGGNIFNRQILKAFDELNKPCIRLSIDEIWTLNTTKEDSIIVDTLYLDSLDENFIHQNARKYLIVHMLATMNPHNRDPDKTIRQLMLFDTFIANSEFTRHHIQSLIGASIPCVVVKPFIQQYDLRQDLTKEKYFVWGAIWERRKLLSLWLDSLNEHSFPENFIIYLCGDMSSDTEYVKECLDKIANSKLLNSIIEIKGKLNQSDFIHLLAGSLAYIDTSGMETYGMAVAEAIVNDVTVLSLGGGNISNFDGVGKCVICRDFDELNDRMVNLFEGDQIVHKPIMGIISEWNEFINQLHLI